MANVGVIDADESYARQLVNRIESISSVESVLYWQNAASFIEALDRMAPSLDLLFVAFRLPDISGLELIKHLDRKPHHFVIAMLTDLVSEKIIFESLTYGAYGYILKNDLLDIEGAINTLLSGGVILTPTIAACIAEKFRRRTTSLSLPDGKTTLSPRERDVLELITCGMTVVEAATAIGLSPHTVRVHVKSIYRKLCVSNRVELMFRVIELGLL